MSIVDASLLESLSGWAFLFVFFHGFIKGFGGKNSETSLLVRIILTFLAGLSKVGVGLCLLCSSSVLGPYGLAHRGGGRIRSIVLSGTVLHIIHNMILLVTILAKDIPKTPRWMMMWIALATKRPVPPLLFLTSPFLADSVTLAPWPL